MTGEKTKLQIEIVKWNKKRAKRKALQGYEI
jgi:hypothetical protein